MRKDKCSEHFSWAQLIECGETYRKTKVNNWPREESSYSALRDLAINLLDPIVNEFGKIEITYGFCSFELSKHITKRVAHKIDQHCAMERNSRGNLICRRGGAAVDFHIPQKTSLEVGKFVVANLPFDRLYYYGGDRPLHLSYGPEQSRSTVHIKLSKTARRRIPKNLTKQDFLSLHER